MNKKYSVAATDLEFSDFIGYLSLRDDQVELDVPTIIPEVLEDYTARHSPVHASESGRILVEGKQTIGDIIARSDWRRCKTLVSPRRVMKIVHSDK